MWCISPGKSTPVYVFAVEANCERDHQLGLYRLQAYPTGSEWETQQRSGRQDEKGLQERKFRHRGVGWEKKDGYYTREIGNIEEAAQ